MVQAQIIGVGAAVVGDMSSRPYWGLYELDFVFSTLVVRSNISYKYDPEYIALCSVGMLLGTPHGSVE